MSRRRRSVEQPEDDRHTRFFRRVLAGLNPQERRWFLDLNHKQRKAYLNLPSVQRELLDRSNDLPDELLDRIREYIPRQTLLKLPKDQRELVDRVNDQTNDVLRSLTQFVHVPARDTDNGRSCLVRSNEGIFNPTYQQYCLENFRTWFLSALTNVPTEILLSGIDDSGRHLSRRLPVGNFVFTVMYEFARESNGKIYNVHLTTHATVLDDGSYGPSDGMYLRRVWIKQARNQLIPTEGNNREWIRVNRSNLDELLPTWKGHFIKFDFKLLMRVRFDGLRQVTGAQVFNGQLQSWKANYTHYNVRMEELIISAYQTWLEEEISRTSRY